MPLLLLPYSLLGLTNFFLRRHDATVRSTRRTSEKTPSKHSDELKERETLGARLLLLKLLYQYLALPTSVATRESLLPTVRMRAVLEPAGLFLEAPVPLLPSVHFVVPSLLPLGQLLFATAQ